MTNKIYNWTDFVPENLLNLDVGSDNYKLFQSIVDYGIKQYDGIEKEKQWISIDNAQGKALDRIGENYGEYRGEADDTFFKFMIKSKILSSRSKGTANEIINIIQKSLDVDVNKIIVNEKRVYDHTEKQFNGDPFTISVEKLPLSFTVDAFQKKYLIKRIEDCTAEGIKLDNISFLDYGNAYGYIGYGLSKRTTKTSSTSYNAYTIGENIFSEKNSVDAYLRTDGSLSSKTTSGITSDYIKTNNSDILIQIFELGVPPSFCSFVFYDINKKILSIPMDGYKANFDEKKTLPYRTRIEVPNGAEYFRISFYGNSPRGKKKKVEFGNSYTEWSPNPDDI